MLPGRAAVPFGLSLSKPLLALNPFGLSLSKRFLALNPFGLSLSKPLLALNPFGLSLSKPLLALNPFGLSLSKPLLALNPFGLSLSKPLLALNPFGLSLSKPLFAALLAFAPLAASAQAVQFAGTMGAKALLVIDGTPKTLAVGEAHAGVKLLSMGDGQAQVERGGAKQTLQLGGAPIAVGGGIKANPGAREIVLTAGPGGHFVTQGAINGRPVQFMVDTGATSVAMGRNEAERIGLDWKSGRQVMVGTANGPAVASAVTLSAVRVGEVTVSNVTAVISPAPMPYVLLGNSFLTRFQMRRENDVMRLELR